MHSFWTRLRLYGGVAALVAGCSGESEQGAPAGSPGEPSKASTNTPAPQNTAVAELLAKPPPPLSANGRAIEKLAKHFGVGLYRCPVPANGRLRQMYGTERDRMFQMGPMWDLEIDDATDPVWDFIFDEVTAEDNWVTGLAMPGATRSYARGRTQNTYAFTYPPAVAGSTVVCTSSEEHPPRTVKGTVKGEKPFTGDALLAFCAGLNDLPTFINPDGTFEATMPVPCVIWVEQPGYRTEKITVEPGTEPLTVSLTLQRDPLQEPGGGWSVEGKKIARETLDRAMERWGKTNTFIDSLKGELTDNKAELRPIQLFSGELLRYKPRIERAILWLDEPPPDPPPPGPRLDLKY